MAGHPSLSWRRIYVWRVWRICSLASNCSAVTEDQYLKKIHPSLGPHNACKVLSAIIKADLADRDSEHLFGLTKFKFRAAAKLKQPANATPFSSPGLSPLSPSSLKPRSFPWAWPCRDKCKVQGVGRGCWCCTGKNQVPIAAGLKDSKGWKFWNEILAKVQKEGSYNWCIFC